MSLLSRIGALALATATLCGGLTASAAAGPLAIVSSIRVDAPKGLYRFQPLRFSFTVRNETGAPVKAGFVRVPVRGPGHDPLDVPCAGGIDITIAAGQPWTCDAYLFQGYGSLGTYDYWADWASPNGGPWHQGELGPVQQLTLTDAPATSIAGAGPWSLGDQEVGTAGAVTPVLLTNVGAASLLIGGVELSGANAGDFAIVGDECTPVAIAPGAGCALRVRFTPAALGPRAATVLVRANTSPATMAVNLTGTGIGAPADIPAAVEPSAAPPVAAPVPAAPAPATPERLLVTLSYNHIRGKRSTRFSRLEVKGVPAGATVAVRCARGCSRKTLSTTTTKKGVLTLKPFVRKPLKAGTKIVVTVTRAGAVGMVKTLTVRAGKDPSLTTKCLAPGAVSAAAC